MQSTVCDWKTEEELKAAYFEAAGAAPSAAAGDRADTAADAKADGQPSGPTFLALNDLLHSIPTFYV